MQATGEAVDTPGGVQTDQSALRERIAALEVALRYERERSNEERQQSRQLIGSMKLEMYNMRREFHSRINDLFQEPTIDRMGYLKVCIAVGLPLLVLLLTGSIDMAFKTARITGGVP